MRNLAIIIILFSLTTKAKDTLANPTQPIIIQLSTNGLSPYDPANHGKILITFYNAVLGRLVDFSEEQTLIPSLLEKFYWDYSKSEYHLHLRSGIRFHNNRLITAEDLDFSLMRFFFTEKRADQVAALKGILGTEKIQRGSTFKPWSATGLRKTGKFSVAIKLKHPDATFPYCFRDGWLSLVPKEALKDDYITWKKYPIGAGPFQVEEKGSRSTYVRLSATVPQSKTVEKLVFATQPHAKPDIVLHQSKVTHSAQRVLGELPDSYVGIFFNPKNPLAKDLEFRKKVSDAFALDRKNIVQNHAGWKPLKEVLPTNFGARVPARRVSSKKEKRSSTHFPRSVRAAWITGKDPNHESQKELLTRIRHSLVKAGIQPKFLKSTHPTLAPNDEDTVFKVGVRGTLVVDPLILFRAYEPPGLLSRYFIGNKHSLSTLLRKAEGERNFQKRLATTSQIATLFDQQVIVVPLFERLPLYFINPDRILSVGKQYGVGFDVTQVKVKK